MLTGLPPSPIPAPLPPWARWLLQAAPLINLALQEALQYIGTLETATAPAPDEWRHLQCVGHPVGSTDPRERFVTTFDIVNVTNGAIDNTWNQADYDTVSVLIGGLMNTWAASMSTHVQWQEIRFYRRQFNALTDPHPFVKSGTPVFIFPNPTVGNGGSPQAPQVSVTTTDRTTYPRHWGRNYWPWPWSGTVDSSGMISTVLMNSFGLELHDVYQALMNAEFFPVTPVTQIDKVRTAALLGTTEVQVDNVFDVIRRRRAPVATARYKAPV